MKYIKKENYIIKYDTRRIRIFLCEPNQSWYTEFQDDLSDVIDKVIIRTSESYSAAIGTKVNTELCATDGAREAWGVTIPPIISDIVRNSKIEKKRRTSRLIGNLSSKGWGHEEYFKGLSANEKKEACAICGDMSDYSKTRYNMYYALTVENGYKSSSDGKFIMDKNLLEKRLRELSEAPYSDIPFGAMCYSPLFWIDYVEYECPKCGKTTKCDKYDVNALEKTRSIIDDFRDAGYDVIVIEPELCEYCSNKRDKGLTYTFKIRFDSAEEYHVAEVNDTYDFICLHSFFLGGIGFHGDHRHEDGMLYDNINTIHRLTGLGVDTLKQWNKNHKDEKGIKEKYAYRAIRKMYQ